MDHDFGDAEDLERIVITHQHLDHLGLACTRLRIEAQTDQGETLSRVWRYDPTPTASTTRRPSGPAPAACRRSAIMRFTWRSSMVGFFSCPFAATSISASRVRVNNAS